MGEHVAVIGGGPAGLIAAETIARDGVDVTVFDHRRSVGRKFVLAGRGGLNLTHSESRDLFVTRYDDPVWAGRLLDAFGPDDLRSWSSGLGQPTFVGSSGRVFPEAFRATPLLRAWLARLDDLGVELATQRRWLGWTETGHRFAEPDGSTVDVDADGTVLALGGASWPHVGSDGSWTAILASAGVEVSALRASNAGVRIDWSRSFVERFAGTPLKNVAVGVGEHVVRGDAIVTRAGLEGGPVYGVGRHVRTELERAGAAELSIDLHPDRSVEQLASRLARRRPKDSTTTWLRRAVGLHPVAINLVREASPDGMSGDPLAVANAIKHVPLVVRGLMPLARAISTAGGVARHELDHDLMLRARPGTFVAGEMIDWDAPTGGYLLQLSFSSGVVAGHAAAKWSRAARGRSRSLNADDG